MGSSQFFRWNRGGGRFAVFLRQLPCIKLFVFCKFIVLQVSSRYFEERTNVELRVMELLVNQKFATKDEPISKQSL